jgi:uncharacterized protein (TIGR02246 family)
MLEGGQSPLQDSAAEESMESNLPKQRQFIPYPTNRVVGTVADAEHARAAINALLQAGFEGADIDILHGDEDMLRLDPTGAEHGFLAQFQRTVLRTLASAEEYKHLTQHVDDVRAGRFVIMVLAKRREERMVAADVLNANGADFIGFYGRWAWEGYAPAGVETARTSGSADEDAHGFARQPEQVPALFAEAWNRRDPEGIASLFEDDAEFVNVTGLWWHQRASIRKAHAYGLERVFNQSTLTVDEVGVKPLSDSIAVVHARMTLSGQTPVGTVRQPGARTSIFSFVLRRLEDRWLCASAHNTDVVPRMETNVVDDDGTFRAANYRTGQVS